MLNILIDTSPLGNDNAIRGVGVYTRELVDHLEKLKGIKVFTSKVDLSDTKPNIIHYPYFDFFFNTLPIKRPAKTVVTVHDVIPLIFPEHYKPGVKGKLKFLKQKKTLQGVDAVITDSESSKNDIVTHLGVDENKVHVVYLSASDDFSPQDQTSINKVKRKYSLPKNYMLYVGDINYNKNIPQLIKSLKFLPNNVKLVCLGKNFKEQDIPEWQWIETQIALSDVAGRVKFINNLDSNAKDDLSAIYSGALCYVQPSLYEGFGLPVLEAMKCKTPVVSTHNSSLIEVANEYGFFTKDETAESIAASVEEVLAFSDRQRAIQLNKAYEWAKTFNWSKTAEKTLEVYKLLVR